MSDLPMIGVLSLGGTIAMRAGRWNTGAEPADNADDLVAAVPQLADIARITTDAVCNVASGALTTDTLREVEARASALVAGGCVGVVVTQGTDTLEETSFVLDLWWRHNEPLVFTGAMRTPEQPGADGPGNLLTAVTAAASERLRGEGVLVAFNDTVHRALTVAKTSSTSTDAFTSPAWGPLAWITEGRVVTVGEPGAGTHRRVLQVPPPGPVEIPMLFTGLDDDGRYIRALTDTGVPGLVVASFGAGHLSPRAAAAVADAVNQDVPVVFATRTGSGTTLQSTYGYVGSERWLLDHGAVGAGFLSPQKARLLLHCLISSEGTIGQIQEEFAVRGLSGRVDT